MNLRMLRGKIDKLDDQFLIILSRRFKICREIALLKKKKKTSIEKSHREKELIARHSSNAKKYNLDMTMIQKIFWILLEQSKKEQEKIKNAGSEK